MADWRSLVSVLVGLLLLAHSECDDRPGHLQPLGSHRPPEGDVEVLDYIPHPIEFYEKYVSASKPVLMRGATRGSRAFRYWNDAYLAEKFGKLLVMTEHGKKENRSDDISYVQLKTFLKRYNETDEYLVETLPPPMRDDFQLLKSLLCGGFTQYLRDAVIWFSSGGTKSVLHMDGVDNINCLMSGSKDLFLAHKNLSHLAHMDASPAHSNVDVDSVDMDVYPGLGQIPWWRGHMEAGDCFYIPVKWYHQIRSFDRNLAINIWWVPVPRFDASDCYVDGDVNAERKSLETYASLSNFSFAPGEVTRNEILEVIAENPEKKIKKLYVLDLAVGMVENANKALETAIREQQTIAVDKLFKAADTDEDGYLDRLEVLAIPSKALIEVFGSQGGDEAGERKVMDTYAREHEGIVSDELDDQEIETPEGFTFPDDYDPETFDMEEFFKAEREAEERAKKHREEL